MCVCVCVSVCVCVVPPSNLASAHWPMSLLLTSDVSIHYKRLSLSYLCLEFCFVAWFCFVLSYKVEYCSFKVSKKCVGALMGIALNLIIAFDKMVIFTMLILLIHECERSFHLLISCQYISSKT